MGYTRVDTYVPYNYTDCVVGSNVELVHDNTVYCFLLVMEKFFHDWMRHF